MHVGALQNNQSLLASAGNPASASCASRVADDAHASRGSRRPVGLVVLTDIARGSRLWGYRQFLLGRHALMRAPGMGLFKMLGSGNQGGFGLRPSASRQGMFCVFQTDAHADAFVRTHPLIAGYRAHAAEFFCVKLRAISARGSWSGQRPFEADLEGTAAAPDGTVAALTRASIRPLSAAAFWRYAAPAETSLLDAPGCLLAAGLGEAPLLRQATFSIWDRAASMDAYARHGAHQAAIHASARGTFFSESMFVRFIPYAAEGSWRGRRVELPALPFAGDA